MTDKTLPKNKTPDYQGLKAIFLNCTLKTGMEKSHTRALMDVPAAIMESAGCSVDHVRVVDHELAPGVQPDMTEHGASHDDWPDIAARVLDADIMVIGTPIWLGEPSSVCRRLIERLYAISGWTNDKGQSVYYGRAGGCVITGNEDGVKHCSMSILYSLSHLGYTVPPQADCGWIGEVGPGPSYGDKGSGGMTNAFTQKNATIMAWNLMHLAALMKSNGGLSNYGNDRKAFEAGETFNHPNPKYRS